MIHKLHNLFPASDCSTRIENGRWVRAVCLPFESGLFDRLRDAWHVLRGRCYAVHWAKHGELEEILDRAGETIVPILQTTDDVRRRAHQLGMHKKHVESECKHCFDEAVASYIDICTAILTETIYEDQIGAFVDWFRKFAYECNNFLVFNEHPAYAVGDFVGVTHDSPDFSILVARAAKTNKVHLERY